MPKVRANNVEVHVFEDCSHAPIYENVAAFNEVTLDFMRKHSGSPAGVSGH